MLYSGTDQESHITEYTLVYEEHGAGVIQSFPVVNVKKSSFRFAIARIRHM